MMTGADFRIALIYLDIPQKRFAAMTGYRAETISRWATGSQPVPRVVELTVDLLRASMMPTDETAYGMQSFTEIINAWPHPSKLAEDVGVSPALVAVWKSRDTIPAAYWNWVVDAAQKRGIEGISFDVLGHLIRAKRTIPTEPQPPEAAQ